MGQSIRPHLTDLSGYIGCSNVDLGANVTWTIATPPNGYDLQLTFTNYRTSGMTTIYDGPYLRYYGSNPGNSPITSWTSQFYINFQYPWSGSPMPTEDLTALRIYYNNYNPYGNDDPVPTVQSSNELPHTVGYCSKNQTYNSIAPAGQFGCMGFAADVHITWNFDIPSESSAVVFYDMAHFMYNPDRKFLVEIWNVNEDGKPTGLVEPNSLTNNGVTDGLRFQALFVSTEASTDVREGFFAKFGTK